MADASEAVIKPKVFLSSVVNSLRAFRATLSEQLTTYGYQMVVSETTLDTDPFLKTLDNCLALVAESDILVLILDQHYGTPVDGKWFVREEFWHARRLGKFVRVLAEERLWDTLPKWRQNQDNPDLDPQKVWGVDRGVLEFFSEVLDTRIWCGQFKHDEYRGHARKLREHFNSYFARLLQERARYTAIHLGSLIERMNYYYRQGSYVQAILVCREILKLDPENSEALLSLAVSRIRLHGMHDSQTVEEGIKSCLEILNRDPKNYRARYNLANFELLSPQHTTEEVVSDLERLYAEFPDYKHYFDNDREFKTLFDLRRAWAKEGGARG